MALYNLKSNMDRFIDGATKPIGYELLDLKSNMDRFIVATCISDYYCIDSFKIQYG